MGAFIVAVLVAFLRNLKQPSAAAVPWRKLARWTLPVLAAFVVWVFTNIPQYLAAYPTENSLTTYLGMTGVSFVLGSAAVYGVVFVLLGLGWFFLARAYGSEVLPGSRVVMPALYYRDALVLGACGVAIFLGMARLRDLLERLWPVNHYAFPAGVPAGLDAAPPALQALAGAVMSSFIAAGILALVAGFASFYLHEAWKQILSLGVLAFLAAPRWGSAAELAAECRPGLGCAPPGVVGGAPRHSIQPARLSPDRGFACACQSSSRTAAAAELLLPRQRRCVACGGPRSAAVAAPGMASRIRANGGWLARRQQRFPAALIGSCSK